MNAAGMRAKALLIMLVTAALAVGIWFFVVYAKRDGSMTDGTFVYENRAGSVSVCEAGDCEAEAPAGGRAAQNYDSEEPARDTWRPLNGNRGYFV